MKRTNFKFRLWMWYAVKVLKVPYTVNFNPPGSEDLFGVGFAWTPQTAQQMRGNDHLREQLTAANQRIIALSHNRKTRRIMNRAAKKAAEARK